MRPTFRRPAGVLAVIGLVLSLVPAAGVAQDMAAPNGGCQLDQIAFCDTFDAPSPNGDGTRAGDLDGVVWGVSRATSEDNPSQHGYYKWNASQLNRCGSMVNVAPPRDVQICNGRLVESLNDKGGQVVLAMYPKQPFDFAGRTGKVVFDVSNDTQGPHTAWPEIVVTDQPVPAPSEDLSGLADFARNSFGMVFGAACLNGAIVQNGQGDSWAVETMWTTSSYAFHLQHFTLMGCVKKSPGPNGPMNHVEIDISPSHVDVFATDPGATTLKQIAAADIAMPLTRGLLWLEDVHYNADKYSTQGNHTLAWDNFGFDGPILPRDLGFDVLDATHNGTSSGDLGYLVPEGRTLGLEIPNVHDVGRAAAALLEFTWWPHKQASITYSVNGNPSHKIDWPYGNQSVTYKSTTLAVPVPLGELVDGTNAISLSSSDSGLGGVSVANVDLILVAAGGLPDGAPAPPAPAPDAPAPPAPAPDAPAPDAPAPDAPAPDASSAM